VGAEDIVSPQRVVLGMDGRRLGRQEKLNKEVAFRAERDEKES